MTDLRPTIIPKSDQLNADDLLSGPATIKITKVYANPSSAEQPIAISFDGDNNKPYLPCKSMRRVLVNLWGPDGNVFVGRSLTLYRDPLVRFGGLEVGGIRISHASHIDKEVTMALTATRANRKPFTVKPMPAPPKPAADTRADPLAGELGWEWMQALRRALNDAKSQGEAERIGGHPRVADAMADPDTPVEAKRKITAMLAGAYAKLAASPSQWSDDDGEVHIAGEDKLGAG